MPTRRADPRPSPRRPTTFTSTCSWGSTRMMSEGGGALPLPVVDGRRLEKPYRDALAPGGFLCDRAGRARQLPRYFYEIPSWTAALELEVTPHFKLWEFVHTDV